VEGAAVRELDEAEAQVQETQAQIETIDEEAAAHDDDEANGEADSKIAQALDDVQKSASDLILGEEDDDSKVEVLLKGYLLVRRRMKAPPQLTEGALVEVVWANVDSASTEAAAVFDRDAPVKVVKVEKNGEFLQCYKNSRFDAFW
jgi:hypothetical protein